VVPGICRHFRRSKDKIDIRQVDQINLGREGKGAGFPQRLHALESKAARESSQTNPGYPQHDCAKERETLMAKSKIPPRQRTGLFLIDLRFAIRQIYKNRNGPLRLSQLRRALDAIGFENATDTEIIDSLNSFQGLDFQLRLTVSGKQLAVQLIAPNA